ncbi:hypothetical protein GF336_03170 [Candidatus Woesearchaeota archaeon]|nr:hypothetical protein [Candidatus Woesearchaeota archaeon]
MAHTKGVPKSILLMGVMYKGEEILEEVLDRLKEKLGEIKIRSEAYGFDLLRGDNS